MDTALAAPETRVMRELERSLGLTGVVSVSMSAMLGSGIFVLPGLAAQHVGEATWLAYLVAGLSVVPAALSKAELATAMPISGGTYVYVDRVFGPLAGTLVGLALWVSVLLKGAFALIGLGVYLVVLGDWPLIPVALCVLVLIVVLNLAGMRSVSRAQSLVLALAVAGLFAVAVAGWSGGGFATPSGPSEWVGLISAAGLVFVAYNGVTKIAAVAEEVERPERNLPLGILLSLLLISTLYVLVAAVLTANLPADQLSGDLRPVYTLGLRLWGPTTASLLAVLAVLTMASMANAGLLAASRFPFAMSRDRLLPEVMHRLSPRFRTPVAAILATGAAMAGSIVLLDVERLAKLASSLVIILFILDNVSVVVFREGSVTWYKPSFRAPLYPWLQIAGVMTGLALLALLGSAVVFGLLLVAVPGLPLFLLYGRRRTARLGVVGQRGPRVELYNEGLRRLRTPQGVREAGVVVSLFGQERGPEMLVEVGAALADGRRVQVVHLTEIAEHTPLGAVLDEEPLVRSLRRRVTTMSELEGVDLDFRALASRDIVHTVHAVTSHASCDWLVLQWQGRRRRAVLPFNPLGWLINHLTCNLALFRDAGVRYVRRVVVFPRPGPHDALVVGTADDLARQWNAKMTLIGFVPDAADTRRVKEEHDYLAQLSPLCSVPCRTELLRGENDVAALAAVSASYDLLVMDAPHVTPLRQLLGARHERIVEHAACSVLSVKTPRERTHEAFQRRGLSPEAEPMLLRFLSAETSEARLEVTQKDALFRHLSLVFSRVLGVDAQAIYEAVWSRERTQNTSVGQGVALPHATLDAMEQPVFGVFTTREPVVYGGPDGAPVDVFFFTAGPPSARRTHLRLLSEIANLSLNTNLLVEVRRAETSQDLVAAVRACVGSLREAKSAVSD